MKPRQLCQRLWGDERGQDDIGSDVNLMYSKVEAGIP